jgi:hypothetical protein
MNWSLRVVGAVVGVAVVLVSYLLILAGLLKGAEGHCEGVAGEDGVVIKTTIDLFNPSTRTCIYADEHGLVHKVKLD